MDNMIQIKFLLISLILVVHTHQTDYCDRQICGMYHHIACGNPGTFANICVKPSLVAMTPALRKLILHKHNYYRNYIASGRLKGFWPAARMPMLKWNEELATFSKLNVKQCQMKHDECRNTFKYKYCGQNLGHQSSSTRIKVETTINKLIGAWYDEHTKATMRDITSFRGHNRQLIGHFTAMVQERASEVGCAISTYTLGEFKHLLLACDYSYTNVDGVPVYTTGKSCKSCKTGCNRQFPALCTAQENVNQTFY